MAASFEDSKEGKPLILYDKKAEFSGSVPNPKSGKITKITMMIQLH